MNETCSISLSVRTSVRASVRAILATTALATGAAQAQTGSDPGGAPNEQLDEVVVNARKYLPDDRTSGTGLPMKLIETPAAISVLTEEMLRIANSRSAYDAADMIPGVEKSGQSSSREYLYQRGNQVFSRINGVGGTRNSHPDAFALERLEFARGPTTGIYGVSGSFAGEVNSVLKKPRTDLMTEASVQVGSFDRTRYELDATSAIPGTGERLSARLLGAYTEYGTPVTTVNRTNRDKMVLASLAYEPAPDWQAVLHYYREDRNLDPMDGCAMMLRPDGTLALPDIDARHFYCGDPNDSWQKQTQEFSMASIAHQFGNEWEVKASVGRAKTHDAFSYMYPFGPAGAYGNGESEVLLYTYDPEFWQEQLTYNMSLGGGFSLFGRSHRFFVGLEYNDQPRAGNRDKILRSVGVGVLDMRDGGLGILADGSPIPFVDRSTLPVSWASRRGSERYSGTVQLLLNPIGRLQVLAGVSLLAGSSSFYQRTEPLNPAEETDSPVKLRLGKEPRFGVTYQLTDGWKRVNDARVYASYFESSSNNTAGFPPVQQTSTEVGLKTELFDGTLTGSLAAYDQKVDNIVVFVYEAGGIADARYEAAGSQTTRGIETEILGQVVPGWNMSLTYGYTDAVRVDARGSSVGGLLEVPIRAIPKNRISLFTTYEFLTGSLSGLRVGGAVVYKQDYPFVDASTTLIDRFGQFKGSGYTRLDLNFSYVGFSGALANMEIFGNIENLTDVDYFYSRNGDPRFTIIHAAPRTVNVGVRYSFDARARRR